MGPVKMLLYKGPGKPEFIFGERVKPLPNQAGIEIIASSLCNTSELRSFYGGYEKGYGSVYPMIPGEPGHEGVGVITDICPANKDFKRGDMVVLTGHGGDPCHRSYVVRNTDDIAGVDPKQRDLTHAATLEMFGCAHHCSLMPLPEGYYKGRNVLIIGMGAMGLCTVQILKNQGIKSITGMDMVKERLERAGNSGAHRVLLSHDLDETEYFDVIIECSGTVGGQEVACRMAPGVLIFSSYNTKTVTIKQNLWFDSCTTIYNPGILTSKSLRAAALMYNRGEIEPEILVDRKIKTHLGQYLDAIRAIEQGKTVKTLMEWDG